MTKKGKAKPRDCYGCVHEYQEEPDECPDCFDYTKDGFDALRKHYKGG